MTGREHALEAERLLELARELDVHDAAPTLAAAQVHATLALAAGTVTQAEAVARNVAQLSDELSRVGEYVEESMGHAKVTADALGKIAHYAGMASW